MDGMRSEKKNCASACVSVCLQRCVCVRAPLRKREIERRVRLAEAGGIVIRWNCNFSLTRAVQPPARGVKAD